MKTFEEAYRFVLEHKICTVFGSQCSPYPSLWDNCKLNANKPAKGGWSKRVLAVWDWKTRLPQTFPDEIFYGKLPGGDAALIEMNNFRTSHFPAHYRPISELDQLAQDIFQQISLEPDYTGPLRKKAIEQWGCTKSQFESALKRLQITLNIVRSSDPRYKNDFWLSMREVHLEIFSSLGI